MKTSKKSWAPKLLRHAFLALTAGVGLLLLLNLTAYFGITSSGPFLRGKIETQGLQEVAKHPLLEQAGELRVYDFKQTKLVLMDFATAESFFQLRHFVYLFFQNMTWGLAVFVLYQMFRIFKNLDRRETFLEENVRRIRWIALAIFIYPFLGLESNLQLRAILSNIPEHGLAFPHIVIFTEQVMFGMLLSLIVYALSEAFRHGSHLQQEQDLTI